MQMATARALSCWSSIAKVHQVAFGSAICQAETALPSDQIPPPWRASWQQVARPVQCRGHLDSTRRVDTAETFSTAHRNYLCLLIAALGCFTVPLHRLLLV